MRSSNDTYGLQNRTYIVTTILVSQCKIQMVEGFVGGWAGEMGETKKGWLTSYFFMIKVPKRSTPANLYDYISSRPSQLYSASFFLSD